MTTCPQCGEAVGIDGLCDQCELAAKEERKRNDELAETTHPPDITVCTDCGENTPESGFVCDECKLNALND